MARKKKAAALPATAPLITPAPTTSQQPRYPVQPPLYLGCLVNALVDRETRQGVLMSDEVIDGDVTVEVDGVFHVIPVSHVTPVEVTPAPAGFSGEEVFTNLTKKFTAMAQDKVLRDIITHAAGPIPPYQPPIPDPNLERDRTEFVDAGDHIPPQEEPEDPWADEGSMDPTAPAPISLPQEVVTQHSFTQERPKPAPVSNDPRRLTRCETPHVIGRARAGTGKTWTMIEGLKAIRGQASTSTPSDEQNALIEQIARSYGARSVGAVAFNKSIADEWKRKVPQGVDAKTLHGMGMGAVLRTFNLRQGEDATNKYKVEEIVCEMLQKDLRELRRERPTFLSGMKELVRLSKMNLFGVVDRRLDAVGADWDTLLGGLISRYEIDVDENDLDDMVAMVPQVLERCTDPTRDGCIDFDDMVWLPCVTSGMRVFRYDLLGVDEAQDLNPAQQYLAELAGKRLVFIGDNRQAIYGFTGAMTDGIDQIESKLCDTPYGCVTLPLTMTRRCGRAIVEEAKKIVPDFQAHPDNPPGKVGQVKYPIQESSNYWLGGSKRKVIPYEQTYLPHVKPGDMVLCRVNSHLILQCNEFHRRGKRAFILGRNVGEQVMALVEKMEAKDVTDLISKVTDWKQQEMAKEQAKRYPSEGRLISIEARADSVVGLCDQSNNITDLKTRIKYLFTDDPKEPGVLCSSIHKAKGLEADHVWFLMPKGGQCPHPMAKTSWQKDQEMNLKYVGITRAIHEMHYVL